MTGAKKRVANGCVIKSLVLYLPIDIGMHLTLQ